MLPNGTYTVEWATRTSIEWRGRSFSLHCSNALYLENNYASGNQVFNVVDNLYVYERPCVCMYACVC